jgi:hypothetical protein
MEDFKTGDKEQACMQVEFVKEGSKSNTDVVLNNSEEIMNEANDISNAWKE